jgi:two-component system nitrate/nitrite response regulator NarL
MSALMAAGTVRVLIVDDHDLFVDALRALLETEQGIDVVATAPNGLEAVERVVELEPEVVLMDVSMPVLDGFEATRAIRKRAPSTRVLFVTGSNAEEDLERAREVGATGYISKDKIAAELVGAIRGAAGSDG